MLEGPIASVKHKLDIALKTTIGAVAALAAAIVALGFFCAAAFLWIEDAYGPLVASLILGGGFLVIALIALLVIVLLQRRKPPPAPPRALTVLSDPVLLSAALDVGRALGGNRRAATAAVAGAFVLGILLNRPLRARGASRR